MSVSPSPRTLPARTPFLLRSLNDCASLDDHTRPCCGPPDPRKPSARGMTGADTYTVPSGAAAMLGSPAMGALVTSTPGSATLARNEGATSATADATAPTALPDEPGFTVAAGVAHPAARRAT